MVTIDNTRTIYGRPYFIVSLEALAEKLAKWHEIPGMADGYAHVEHADWFEVLRLTGTQSCCIGAKLPDGKIAHIGSITCYGDRHEVLLQG